MRTFLVLAAACCLLSACGGDGDSEATCASVCPDVVAADCANGPANVSECLEGCEGMIELGCDSEMAAVLACSAGKTFTCDEDESPVVSGCDAQNDALNDCIGSYVD